jgi:hypothetical protein
MTPDMKHQWEDYLKTLSKISSEEPKELGIVLTCMALATANALKGLKGKDSLKNRLIRSVPALGIAMGSVGGALNIMMAHESLRWKLESEALKSLPSSPINTFMQTMITTGAWMLPPTALALYALHKTPIYQQCQPANQLQKELIDQSQQPIDQLEEEPTPLTLKEKFSKKGWTSGLLYGGTKIFGTWFAAGAKDTPLANNVVNDRFRLSFDWEKALRDKIDAVPNKGSDSWGLPGLGMGETFKPSGHMMMMTAMNVAWMRTLNHLQKAKCSRLLYTSILATFVANTVFTYNTASKGYHSPTEIAAGLGVAAAVNLLTDGLWYLGKGVGAACSKADSVSPPSKATDGDLGDPNQSTKDGNNLVPVANSNGSSSASIVFLS